MTTKTTTAKSAKNVLMPSIRNRFEGDALVAIRSIVSRETGERHFVLEGDGCETVMPGNWRIREKEFPDGLYEGLRINAGWRKDSTGDDRFYLEPAE